jgi:hypothetical protein
LIGCVTRVFQFPTLRDPSQLFCLCVGELPGASKKVGVVDWSSLVSSYMEQLQADPIVSLAISHHAVRSIQCDDDVFVGRFNTEIQAGFHFSPSSFCLGC